MAIGESRETAGTRRVPLGLGSVLTSSAAARVAEFRMR